MRPGEEEFIHLTNCLINKNKGGHVLTIDYGASFEPLANSLSVDPMYDGIFVPPIPHHLMEELPHCHGDWTVCAGRIDWWAEEFQDWLAGRIFKNVFVCRS